MSDRNGSVKRGIWYPHWADMQTFSNRMTIVPGRVRYLRHVEIKHCELTFSIEAKQLAPKKERKGTKHFRIFEVYQEKYGAVSKRTNVRSVQTSCLCWIFIGCGRRGSAPTLVEAMRPPTAVRPRFRRHARCSHESAGNSASVIGSDYLPARLRDNQSRGSRNGHVTTAPIAEITRKGCASQNDARRVGSTAHPLCLPHLSALRTASSSGRKDAGHDPRRGGQDPRRELGACGQV